MRNLLWQYNLNESLTAGLGGRGGGALRGLVEVFCGKVSTVGIFSLKTQIVFSAILLI